MKGFCRLRFGAYLGTLQLVSCVWVYFEQEINKNYGLIYNYMVVCFNIDFADIFNYWTGHWQ